MRFARLPRFDMHEVLLFVLSGASVAALAIVSISGPVDFLKIALISFGSLAAAVAAPMVESRILTGPTRTAADTDRDPTRTRTDVTWHPEQPEPSAQTGYEVLEDRPVRTSIVGRDAELAALRRRLTGQRNSGKP